MGMQTVLLTPLFTICTVFSFSFCEGTLSLAMFSHHLSLRTMHVQSNTRETQIKMGVAGAILFPLGQPVIYSSF